MFTPEDFHFYYETKKYMELWKDLSIEEAKAERSRVLDEAAEELKLDKDREFKYNGISSSTQYAIYFKTCGITDRKEMLKMIHQFRYFFPRN